MANSSAGKKQKTTPVPESVPRKRREVPRYPTLPPVPEAPEKVGGKIGALIEEALAHKPIELKAEETLEPARKALGHHMKTIPRSMVIEGGTAKEQQIFHTEFKHTPVSGGTFPGQKRSSGLFPENKNGIVIYPDDKQDRLSVYMTNVDGYGPEDAAMANAAAITAAYELTSGNEILQSRMTEFEKMEKVFNFTANSVGPVGEEFGVKEKKIDMLGARLSPDFNEKAWRLDVANNGNNHCIIIDPRSGKLRNARQGVRKPGSKKPVEQPVGSEFIVATGDIVVIATDKMVEAVGGEEKLAAAFTEKLKKGLEIGEICGSLLDDVERRQEDGEIEDSSVSIVAFKVPEFKGILL